MIRTLEQNEEAFPIIRELNKIDKKIKRKDRPEPKFPFVDIFKLYKKGYIKTYISRKLKINVYDVNSIIHGGITIPKSEVKKVKDLGFNICGRCHKRIVPLEPIGYVVLTKLCKICYKRGSELEYSTSSEIKP